MPGFCCPWLKGEAKKQGQNLPRKRAPGSPPVSCESTLDVPGSMPEMQYSTCSSDPYTCVSESPGELAENR